MNRIKPSKIVCVGLNYRQHAREFDMPVPEEPVIFLKPPSALIYDGDEIVYPPLTRELHYEAELGVVMGRTCRNVSTEDARGFIDGYVCANDVTARDLQRKDGQWSRAKSFDTFCPVGRTVAARDTPDPNRLRIRAFLNDRLVQDSNTSDMIFSVEQIVSFVSSVMTLFPQDLILTGTPQGVGPMQKGDRIRIVIEGIGDISNRVV
ncbi:MAG TPA: fumarylacetoacetate hydrolase family protein [Syntrophales bacterium]|mgnify:FL=1|nr:fumarylacetoacetate hydrolase family protein [Syntrophales bacterium]